MSSSAPPIFDVLALETNTAALCFVASLAVVIALRGIWLRKASKNPLPPGPRGLPLLGNLFDMPRHSAWLAFSEWAKEFGALCA